MGTERSPMRRAAAVATLDDISKRGGNLSIAQYVGRAHPDDSPDLETALAAWRTSTVELRDAATELLALLGETES